METSIRQATSLDLSALVALLDAQLREHDITLPPERLERAVEGVFRGDGDGAFLLAVAGGQPVGVAYVSFTWALEHGGRSAWLEELYVTPPNRGTGLGTRLLQAVIDHAREAGAAAVDLEVDAGHAQVERLYARNGFSPHRRARWVRRLTPSETQLKS